MADGGGVGGPSSLQLTSSALSQGEAALHEQAAALRSEAKTATLLIRSLQAAVRHHETLHVDANVRLAERDAELAETRADNLRLERELRELRAYARAGAKTTFPMPSQEAADDPDDYQVPTHLELRAPGTGGAAEEPPREWSAESEAQQLVRAAAAARRELAEREGQMTELREAEHAAEQRALSLVSDVQELQHQVASSLGLANEIVRQREESAVVAQECAQVGELNEWLANDLTALRKRLRQSEESFRQSERRINILERRASESTGEADDARRQLKAFEATISHFAKGGLEESAAARRRSSGRTEMDELSEWLVLPERRPEEWAGPATLANTGGPPNWSAIAERASLPSPSEDVAPPLRRGVLAGSHLPSASGGNLTPPPPMATSKLAPAAGCPQLFLLEAEASVAVGERSWLRTQSAELVAETAELEEAETFPPCDGGRLERLHDKRRALAARDRRLSVALARVGEAMVQEEHSVAQRVSEAALFPGPRATSSPTASGAAGGPDVLEERRRSVSFTLENVFEIEAALGPEEVPGA